MILEASSHPADEERKALRLKEVQRIAMSVRLELPVQLSNEAGRVRK